MTGLPRAALVLLLAPMPFQAPARAVALSAPGFALDLPAGTVLSAERSENLGSTRIPIGPFGPGGVPTRQMEGEVTRRAWRIPDPGLTTLDLLAPVRAAATAAGYDILLDCAAAACGGFDFRYAAEILPEPAMHVDLGDYRSLSAIRQGEAGPEGLNLTVSRDAASGFVQLVTVVPVAPPAIPPAAPPAIPPDAAPATAAPGAPGAPGIDPLRQQGFTVLEGLGFASGGTQLAPGEIPALAALADWLAAHPGATVTLVGHTDASGGAAANLALSRQRAEAVRRRLIAAHGVAAGRLRAEGVGALAPRASNLTAEGREANRRVEAVMAPLP